MKLELVKDEEVHRIVKKMVDLDLHDSSDRTGLKQEYKFKIPASATKFDKPGYEEIVIEAKTLDQGGKRIDISSLP